MIEVTGYDTADEMFEAMQRAEDAANASLLPCQIRLRDDIANEVFWFGPEDDFEVYGHGWTRPMCLASSLDAGCTAAEAASETESVMEARTRGYLFGRAYSVIMPLGEIGSVHVAKVVPITKALFELARMNDWNSRHEVELADAVRQAVTHALREGRS